MIFFDDCFPLKGKNIRKKTVNWSGSDTYKNYRKYSPNPYTDSSITYNYNSYGFRSDEFFQNEYSLVFLGCSVTEGIGLPLDETFSYLIYTQIKKLIGKDFPYWNLGLGGCGLDSIVRCYYNFYGILKPKVVIALFPSYRIEYFQNGWHSVLVNHDEKRIFSKNPYLLNKNVIEYNTEKNLAMLDLLLEKNKSLLIWDKWSRNSFDDIEFSRLENFKNYVDSWVNIADNTNDYPLARDGGHPGKKTNEDFAKLILDKYSDMICDRLVSGAP